MQLTSKESLRYLQQINLNEIGEAGQIRLKKSKLLVVGAGGLGAAALPYLAGAGIGHIHILDDDEVALSNLARQTIYQTQQIGKAKVEASKAYLEALNPSINITISKARLLANNAADYLAAYDLLLDASDNFATRYALSDACEAQNKPMVYGAVSRFEGQLAVFSYPDKKSGEKSASFRCAFPEAPENEMPCSEEGILGTLPGIIGLLQANEVLKIILEIGEILQNRLFYFNALSLKTRVVKIKRVIEKSSL